MIHKGQALEIVLHTLFRTRALFLDDRAHVRQPHVSQEANIEAFPIIGFHPDLSQEAADPRGVLASSEQEVTVDQRVLMHVLADRCTQLVAH